MRGLDLVFVVFFCFCTRRRLSAFACSFEVTVTSVSLPPFVSRRGLSNTNQRLPRFAPFLSKPQDQHVRVVITTQIV